MKVFVESVFACAPGWAWQKVQTTEMLKQILGPLLRFEPLPYRALPVCWEKGQSGEGRLFLFGFLPMGAHTIHIEDLDPEKRVIQTREPGRFVKSWNHRMRVQATDAGQTRYSDEIDIHAGLLTPAVWLFAQVLYRYRHRRWKKFIRESTRPCPVTNAAVPDAQGI